jgi:hypothetical protein
MGVVLASSKRIFIFPFDEFLTYARVDFQMIVLSLSGEEVSQVHMQL